MKDVGRLTQEVPCSTAHQHYVASFGRLAGRLGQAVHILLVGRVQAKAVGHRDGLFIQAVQFGIRDMFDLGGLMEQFAVEQFPAQGLGELSGHFTAAGTVLAADGDDVHAKHSREGSIKTGPTRKNLLVGPGYSSTFPLPEANPQGRGHQQRFFTSAFQGEPHRHWHFTLF